MTGGPFLPGRQRAAEPGQGVVVDVPRQLGHRSVEDVRQQLQTGGTDQPQRGAGINPERRAHGLGRQVIGVGEQQGTAASLVAPFQAGREQLLLGGAGQRPPADRWPAAAEAGLPGPCAGQGEPAAHQLGDRPGGVRGTGQQVQGAVLDHTRRGVRGAALPAYEVMHPVGVRAHCLAEQVGRHRRCTCAPHVASLDCRG